MIELTNERDGKATREKEGDTGMKQVKEKKNIIICACCL
jgi:hypothetical protein